MSYLKSSAARLFEEILEKAYGKLRKSRKVSLEALAEGISTLGDKVFTTVSKISNVLAQSLNRLQIVMIESMILTSLWFGLVMLIIILAVAR